MNRRTLRAALASLLLVVPSLPLAALSSTATEITYTADGTTSTFVFNFKVQATTHVRVFKDGVEQVGGLIFTLNPKTQDTSPGGSITFKVADQLQPPPAGTVVRIARIVPLTQELVLAPYSAFPAKSLEGVLDRLVMQAQQEAAARAAADATLSSSFSMGTPNASLAQVTSAGGTTARTLAAITADVINPAFRGALADGTGDDSAELNDALTLAAATGAPVDGAGKTYRITSSVTVPPGVTLRNAKIVAGTAGMKMVLVSTGSSVLGVKLTGTGTKSIIERGIYPATDGASDVTLDVEVTNITVGVQAQPLVSVTPERWRGRIYAHEIVGTVGASEGYGLLLSPADSCTFEVVTKNVIRHPAYLSAGAKFNDITVDADITGNVVAQLYSLDTQPATRNNTVRVKARNLFTPTGQAAGQSSAVHILGNARQNTITVDVDGTPGSLYGTGTAGAEHAVVVEGFQGAETSSNPGNQIINGKITGAFRGADVIKLLNDDATLVTGNDIRAYGTVSVIAMRYTGTDTRRSLGPRVFGNTINAQGQAITGIYDEVTSVPTYIGLNDIRNNGAGARVNATTAGTKRSGWSREYSGQAAVACSGNAASSAAITFPEAVVNPRITATPVNFSVSGIGQFPAWASSVTTTGASISAYNGNASAQTVTVDWTARGD